MKTLKLIIIFAFLFFFSSCFLSSQTNNDVKPKKFRWDLTLQKGTYLYNSEDLYFFDQGINCFLYNECPDIDSVFENTAKELKLPEEFTFKYQAYIFSDNYEYLYISLNNKKVWIRAEIPIETERKNYLKTFLPNSKPKCSQYVKAIPFKEENKVFVSTTNDWFIVDINKEKNKKIGTKNNRVQACRMIFRKNCVECYIDIGLGETILYDDKGKEVD